MTVVTETKIDMIEDNRRVNAQNGSKLQQAKNEIVANIA
jgi:hypothetical protein